MENQTERKSEYVFSDEQIKNISGLSDTLQKIRARLISEGVSIDAKRDEVLQKPKN